MHSALPAILVGLDAGEPEALLGAGELLRAHRLGVNGTGVFEPYGSIYQAEPLSAEDVGALRTALVSLLESGRCQSPTSVVYALGQLKDPELIPLLRVQLEMHLRHLMEANSAVGQLVLELNDVGEKLFESSFSFSAMNIDENVMRAQRYLSDLGVVVRW